MAALVVPLDGRLTSQNILSGPISSGVMWIVSPGNAAAGNTYQVTIQTLGAYFGAFPVLNTEIITAGATSISPYNVETTDTRILFNKTLASASYAVLPLAATMAYPYGITFKDLKGNASTNNITISFTSGELCDGLSTVQITTDYGWVTIFPVPGGGAWYLG